MRKLYLFGTGIFWLAVLVLWVENNRLPPAVVEVKPPSAEVQIALSDVARHSSDTDCWMAIDGLIYDLTAYLPEHPSRPSIIVPWCGREASEAYQTKTKGRSHSQEANQLLIKYRIGVLSSSGNSLPPH